MRIAVRATVLLVPFLHAVPARAEWTLGANAGTIVSRTTSSRPQAQDFDVGARLDADVTFLQTAGAGVGVHAGLGYVRSDAYTTSSDLDGVALLPIELGVSGQVVLFNRLRLAPWLGIHGTKGGPMGADAANEDLDTAFHVGYGGVVGVDVLELSGHHVGVFASYVTSEKDSGSFEGYSFGAGYRYAFADDHHDDSKLQVAPVDNEWSVTVGVGVSGVSYPFADSENESTELRRGTTLQVDVGRQIRPELAVGGHAAITRAPAVGLAYADSMGDFYDSYRYNTFELGPMAHYRPHDRLWATGWLGVNYTPEPELATRWDRLAIAYGVSVGVDVVASGDDRLGVFVAAAQSHKHDDGFATYRSVTAGIAYHH